ncbi:prolactin-releasing peptide receptor-like [Patiria miniata]|uniref:G-protein coupled receptors family 1 profile domain-containing protein n=1 Tax=Patiria miniata TaxID=46514 RepID=A0A914B6Y2_PATMI|nr:prolactin-releasing peptide receptor-like [Patiria miniata]
MTNESAEDEQTMHDNMSDYELFPNSLHSPGARAIIIICFAVTCLMGIFGNGLICLVLIRRPKMRTVINLFIGNLALSDLVLCSFGAPLSLSSWLTPQWLLGLALCRIYSMITGCMVFVSSLTFTAVAIDRFCLVVYPFLRPITRRTCFISIAIIWVVSIGMILPIGLQTYVIDFSVVDNNTEGIYCMELWDDLDGRRKYSIAIFVLQFVYPLLLVTVAHTSIAIKLKRNVKPGARRRENDAQENKRRSRTNRMLSAVVTVFAVCWLPFCVFSLVAELYVGSLALDPIVFVVVYLLAISSTWLNPMLYAWLNDNFRKEFHRLMPCVPCLRETRNVGCVKVNTPGASTTNFAQDRRPQSSMATYLQPSSVEKSSSGKSGTHDTSM